MKVLLFGMIAEKAGATELSVEASSLAHLKVELEKRIAGLDRMSYAIAVDRRITQEDVKLSGNEEIAVLPPFAGG
jgi:molybdopterin synthase sulfur carrier subunit